MKLTNLLAIVLMIGSLACHKKTEADDCVAVTITKKTLPCTTWEWEIKVNGITYPSTNIPNEFKRDGLVVCATYKLYPDRTMCPTICCGGTWASIKSMRYLVR